MEKPLNYYLQEAPIIQSIIHFLISMMLGMSVNVIYSIMNAFFIGLLHNTLMMAAVTFGLPVPTILMAVERIFLDFWGRNKRVRRRQLQYFLFMEAYL